MEDVWGKFRENESKIFNEVLVQIFDEDSDGDNFPQRVTD